MTLRPIRPGLRTIHNGSAFVAKAQIVVPPNGELTVPDDVADQLQRDGAFKDGPAPELDNSRLVRANLTGDSPQDLDEISPDAAEVKAPKIGRKKA